MKHSKVSVLKKDAPRGRRLSFRGFARVAALLTLGATPVMLASMLLSGDPRPWMVLAVLCFVTIAVIWTVTIAIGCFVMVPVGIWRLNKRLWPGIAGKVDPQGPLYDRWMDGPEPFVP